MDPAHLTQLLIEYRYWIIIPLSFIEGPIIAFITGTLAFLGYFNAYVAFTVFMVRDVLLDGFFYYLGRFGGRTHMAKRILGKVGITSTHIEEVRVLWDEHGFRTMFFSKLSYGVSAAFLVIAGVVEMSVSRYFLYACLVALAQYGLLFVLGYYFGSAFGTVATILSNLQYVIGGIVLVASAYFIFTRYMRGRLEKQEKEASSTDKESKMPKTDE